jgi:hypothetical protein
MMLASSTNIEEKEMTKRTTTKNMNLTRRVER